MTERDPQARPAESQPFGCRRDGRPVTRFTLRSEAGLTASVTDHGATLVELHVPDRTGTVEDVVLGFDAVEGYESAENAYLGATVGRVANRIAGAGFELEGRRNRLVANEGPHHLHGGGEQAFSQVRWEVVRASSDTLELHHHSPDGAEGYPGQVEVTATYRVEGRTLTVIYQARSDAPTPLDLTNHTYLQLGGHGAGTVLAHELAVAADQVLEVDDEMIPTGRMLEVAGTALDLRTPARLGPRVEALASPPQLGLDHHYVLHHGPDRVRPVAWLHDPGSGRTLELATDQPGLQVYTGNRLDPPVRGKRGRRYTRHGGVCLEPHHHPGALHHPELPTIVLQPGAPYEHRIEYRF